MIANGLRLLLMGVSSILFSGATPFVDGALKVAKNGQLAQSAGLAIFQEVAQTEYAKKYPFFTDAIVYLERHANQGEVARYEFLLNASQDVEVRYDQKTLFTLRQVNPKFSNFILNDFKIQLRNYQTFNQYLSVLQQISHSPKEPASDKKPAPAPHLPTSNPKRNASLINFFMPRAFAVARREALIGAVLATIVIGYTEIIDDGMQDSFADCRQRAERLERDFKTVLAGCFAGQVLAGDDIDENASRSLRRLVANYEAAESEFANYVMNNLEPQVVEQAIGVFARMPQFFMKFKFQDKTTLHDELACNRQLFTGYQHLELPTGGDADAQIKAALETTVGNKQFGSRTTFWLAMTRNSASVKKCVSSVVGDQPVEAPQEPAKPPLAAENSKVSPPGPGVVNGPPEVIVFKRDPTPENKGQPAPPVKENMRPRKAEDTDRQSPSKNAQTFNPSMAQPPTLADEYQKVIGTEDLPSLVRDKDAPKKPAVDNQSQATNPTEANDKVGAAESKMPANAPSEERLPQALQGIPDPNN